MEVEIMVLVVEIAVIMVVAKVVEMAPKGKGGRSVVVRSLVAWRREK